MFVITKPNTSSEQIAILQAMVEDLGLQTMIMQGSQKTVVGIIGDTKHVPEGAFLDLDFVECVKSVSKPYKLVSREFQKEDTIVKVRGIPIGGKAIQIIAGPCSVETPQQMQASAEAVIAAGALFMRGGAFKPRTSPYTFQGHGEKGLEYLVEAAKEYDLPVVTELMDVRDIDKFLKYEVDIIQIGTRNMQNFQLLKEVGRLKVPVILKRGMSATIKEWLMAAEYIAAGGNTNIILAERGIRTFESAYRNVLDVSAIPFLKRETHLPVIVDPSHAGGQSWMVSALSLAAIAAGADGLLIESHPNPAQAWSDGEQALTPTELKDLMNELRLVARVLGRDLGQRNVVPVSAYSLDKTTQPLAA
jgi:3-deoxy-7-phosphoheptulonate synthase